MHAYRFAYRLVLDLDRWLAVAFTVFGLSACGTLGISVTQTIPTKLPTAVMTPRSTPAATATLALTLSAADAWKTYRNERAGYAIDYPATWKVNERIDSNGAEVTTFSPDPDTHGMSVTVIVRRGESVDGEIPDLPNTRCQPAMVGGVSGTRCFDTISFSTMTTLIGQGQTYILVGSGKRLDQNVYQRFLDGFTIKS